MAYVTALSVTSLNRAAVAEAAAQHGAVGHVHTAGYVPQLRKPQAVKHYFDPAYVTDGRVLDPARAVGGCMTRWHGHDNLCSSDPARA